MRVCLLASGSKGNAIFVDTGSSRILVDAGLSAGEILNRLAAVGVEGKDLDAVLVSHEHTDHVRGAGALCRKLKIPLLLSYPTCREINISLRKIEVVEFESGYPFTFKDMLIDPFPITHDACDPVGFVIECRNGKVGIATDLGIATRLVMDKLSGSRILVIESNHDEEMLLNGPYPWHLKQRIKSRHGHLSNTESSQLLEEIIHSGLEGVFLAHLSEVNNDPDIALNAASTLLQAQNVCSPRLVVGCQHFVSEVLTA
ncbi:MAG TPA: MBL fold metallo-hydrolase [Geobacteraceae bacterium]|nr:MBL fold metallo-hydrolase [Geobacteraceae bacterium]